MAFSAELFDQFSAQVNVFEELYAADREETTTTDGLDLSDVRAVMKCVLDNADTNGLKDEVLDMVQQLLLLPTDVSLGGMAWAQIGRMVNSIATASKNYAKLSKWQPEYKMLKDYLEKKQTTDIKLAQLADVDKVIDNQKKKIIELENKLVASNTSNDGRKADVSNTALSGKPEGKAPTPSAPS